MKKIFTLISAVVFINAAEAQMDTVLCNFDGMKLVSFKDYDGILDSAFANPMMTGANTSATCGRYIRKKNEQFDNLKLYPKVKFVDISPFAAANTNYKMSMMVMSKMPVGSTIDIQLGTRTDQAYPSGIHSIYTGTTSVTNQWEKITFQLSLNLSSSNGFKLPGSIDKFVILFHTNALTADTVYFDDVRGPKIEDYSTGIAERSNSSFKISQNQPNPAKDNTTINLELNAAGQVSIVLYDVIGKTVSTVVNSELSTGTHSFDVNTESLPNGVYFYTVKKGSVSQTMKMIVSK